MYTVPCVFDTPWAPVTCAAFCLVLATSLLEAVKKGCMSVHSRIGQLKLYLTCSSSHSLVWQEALTQIIILQSTQG